MGQLITKGLLILTRGFGAQLQQIRNARLIQLLALRVKQVACRAVPCGTRMKVETLRTTCMVKGIRLCVLTLQFDQSELDHQVKA